MKIFAGNLAYSLTDEEMHEFFSQFGEVVSARVIKDRDTGRSRGFGFVEFTSEEAMQAAIEANDQELNGRKVNIKKAEEKARR